MRALMRPAAAILLLAAGVLLAPAANAQVQSPPGLSEQPPNISDQKLDAAAAAIERVASLKQDYQQRIAAAAPCRSRKSYPGVSMMQSGQDRRGCDGPESLDGSTQRDVLAQC